MRVKLTVLAAILLVVAPAAAVDLRPTHDTVIQTLAPAEADIESTTQNVSINCGANRSSNAEFAKHTFERNNGDIKTIDQEAVVPTLPCWGTDDHDLWTNSTNAIKAGSPPSYSCTADGIDLNVTTQNAFPVIDTRPGDPNSDPAKTGVTLSTGTMFVVPEITGADADRIEAIWFGFLETTPTVPGTDTAATSGPLGGGMDELCVKANVGGIEEVHPAGGAYYEFYRGDFDKSDGWTIPINTLLVPDNVYGAYLKFLGTINDDTKDLHDDVGDPSPGALEVLGAGYVYAVVDNQLDDANNEGLFCKPTRADCKFQDVQPPWAQVLPGDVDQADLGLYNLDKEHLDDNDNPIFTDEDGDGNQDVNLSTGDTLVVTFGEHVRKAGDEVNDNTVNSGPTIAVNGTNLNNCLPADDTCSNALEHAEADVDSTPLTTTEEDEWGERYIIDVQGQLLRSLHPCDIITVTAKDLHGNEATKEFRLNPDDCGPKGPL